MPQIKENDLVRVVAPCNSYSPSFNPCNQRNLRIVILLILSIGGTTLAQRGNILYGDLIVEEDPDAGLAPLSYQVILYTINGYILARQDVPAGGRYRFTNLVDGDFD